MEDKLSKRATEQAARARARSEIDRLFAGRPVRLPLPKDILLLALDGYEAGHVPPSSLIGRRNKAVQKIKLEIDDVLITSGQRRSLNRDKSAAAAMIFQSRLKNVDRRGTLIVGWCNTLLFKSDGFSILTCLEPVGADEHLLQRVMQRGLLHYKGISSLTENLSVLWPSLIQLGQRRRLNDERANVTFFVSPWADGYFFADMERMDGWPLGANPYVVEFRKTVGIRHELPDFYANGNTRLFVHFRTFISAPEMKQHQIALRDTLNNWIYHHRAIVEYLKLRGRLAAHSGAIGVDDLLSVFGFEKPKLATIDAAIAELDVITRSENWITEVEFSRRNRLS